jgi:hypothetical protein
MTARARVDDDIMRDGVAIWLADGHPGQRLLAEAVDIRWQTVPAEAVAVSPEPTLRLPDAVARALLDALTAHFGGAPELQTLRKDYVAERARVDKMIDHLIGGGAP